DTILKQELPCLRRRSDLDAGVELNADEQNKSRQSAGQRNTKHFHIKYLLLKSTLSETIHQRPMRAGCWRFLHANDDKVTACGFRNDVRSRKVAFRPTVWLFREFSVRIINMNGLLCSIDFRSQPEPIFIPFKQL